MSRQDDAVNLVDKHLPHQAEILFTEEVTPLPLIISADFDGDGDRAQEIAL